MDTIPEDLLQQAAEAPGMGSEGSNRAWVSLRNPDSAVVETLQGLAKVVCNRHLPRVQGWLKVFVKVSIPLTSSVLLNAVYSPYQTCCFHGSLVLYVDNCNYTAMTVVVLVWSRTVGIAADADDTVRLLILVDHSICHNVISHSLCKPCLLAISSAGSCPNACSS